jgi:hypothetical protein
LGFISTYPNLFGIKGFVVVVVVIQLFIICCLCFYAQTEPAKVCSKLGLCVFDGSHSVGLVKTILVATIDESWIFSFVSSLISQACICG